MGDARDHLKLVWREFVGELGPVLVNFERETNRWHAKESLGLALAAHQGHDSACFILSISTAIFILIRAEVLKEICFHVVVNCRR